MNMILHRTTTAGLEQLGPSRYVPEMPKQWHSKRERTIRSRQNQGQQRRKRKPSLPVIFALYAE